MRLKMLRVTFEVLPLLLFETRWRRTVSTEIPADAVVKRVEVCADRAEVAVWFEHPSFPVVADREAVPVADCPKYEVREATPELTPQERAALADEMAKLPWEE